jgi:GDPmannose 4,6-dehydratase
VFDAEFYRPSEVEYLRGRPDKAESELNWQREVSFTDLVHRMVESDIDGEEKTERVAQKVKFIP